MACSFHKTGAKRGITVKETMLNKNKSARGQRGGSVVIILKSYDQL